MTGGEWDPDGGRPVSPDLAESATHGLGPELDVNALRVPQDEHSGVSAIFGQLAGDPDKRPTIRQEHTEYGTAIIVPCGSGSEHWLSMDDAIRLRDELTAQIGSTRESTDHRAELTASLTQLIARIRRIGGHSTPEEQDQLWAAERLVGV